MWSGLLLRGSNNRDEDNWGICTFGIAMKGEEELVEDQPWEEELDIRQKKYKGDVEKKSKYKTIQFN